MFTGTENHDISLEEASSLTSRYRGGMEEGDRKGGYFSQAALRSILDQKDCVGIRYYYGLDSNNKQVMVLVGVLENENDMADGLIAEASIPCPFACGSDNDLNSD